MNNEGPIAIVRHAPIGQISRVTTKVASQMLGVSIRTLEDWRSKGIGPKFVKIGQKVLRYEIEEINRFIDKGRQTPANAT